MEKTEQKRSRSQRMQERDPKKAKVAEENGTKEKKRIQSTGVRQLLYKPVRGKKKGIFHLPMPPKNWE